MRLKQFSQATEFVSNLATELEKEQFEIKSKFRKITERFQDLCNMAFPGSEMGREGREFLCSVFEDGSSHGKNGQSHHLSSFPISHESHTDSQSCSTFAQKVQFGDELEVANPANS